jgi:hypothetical protein
VKNFLTSLLAVCFLLNISSIVHAETELYDWGINIDGTTYCLYGPCDFDFFTGGQLTALTDLPSSIDHSNFHLTDDTPPLKDGLGTLTITVTGVGVHSVSVYLDYDLDYSLNEALNETGEKGGTPEAGLSWEIDETGWGATGSIGTEGKEYYGDIVGNFVLSSTSPSFVSRLDNKIFFDKIDNQSLVPPIEDTALAQSWDFTLLEGETAVITFIAGSTKPAGFYLLQKDPDSNTEVYLSSYKEGGNATTYTVTPSKVGSGAISPEIPQAVNPGDTTTFTVTPDAGYTASVGGTCGGSLAGTTYTTSAIIADCTVEATFEVMAGDTYTVTPSKVGRGIISPAIPQAINPGDTTTFTVTPDAGYTASVGGTCGGSLAGTTYTTSAIIADCTVEASFTLKSFPWIMFLPAIQNGAHVR